MDEAQIRAPSQKHVEGDAAFEAGQRSAEAVVDAEPEGEMAVRLARKIEGLGIGKLTLVPVRREHNGMDEASLRDRHAGDLRVFPRITFRRGLERTFETQQLFDSTAPQGRIGPKPL